MPKSISRSRAQKQIFQFSVFAENKVGCLNTIIGSLIRADVHLLGMSCLDQTECAVVRFVPDYAETAEDVLKKNKISYSKNRVIAAELTCAEDLIKITQALGQAEINIHYIYPMFCRSNTHSEIVLSTNDLELSESVLSGYGIRMLDHNDLAR